MTPEQLAALVADKDDKGNTIPPVVWVTYHDYQPDMVYLDEVSEEPWEDDYDAPITTWASNKPYVPLGVAEALEAEVARLSAPPDDAETAALVTETQHWGKYQSPWHVYNRAADALTRLSHALAAEKAKREAMEDALHTISGHVVLNNEDDEELSDSAIWARATLAKHGSK